MIRDDRELGTILRRLERLEAENRRFRAISFAAILCVAPLLLVQCAGGHKVTAQQFVVQDDEGKTRATLGFDEEGTRLRLYDEHGIRRAALSLADNGEPGIVLFDAADRPGAILEVTKTGPALLLSDATGRELFKKP